MKLFFAQAGWFALAATFCGLQVVALLNAWQVAAEGWIFLIVIVVSALAGLAHATLVLAARLCGRWSLRPRRRYDMLAGALLWWLLAILFFALYATGFSSAMVLIALVILGGYFGAATLLSLLTGHRVRKPMIVPPPAGFEAAKRVESRDPY